MVSLSTLSLAGKGRFKYGRDGYDFPYPCVHNAHAHTPRLR